MKHKFFIFLLTIAAVLTFGLLSSCGQNSHVKGADGSYFEHETFTRTNFEVEIILMPNEAAIAKEISKHMDTVHGTVTPANVAAFSTIRKDSKKCTIYMIDPKVKYEPEFFGHELVHCIYGIWHHEPQT